MYLVSVWLQELVSTRSVSAASSDILLLPLVPAGSPGWVSIAVCTEASTIERIALIECVRVRGSSTARGVTSHVLDVSIATDNLIDNAPNRYRYINDCTIGAALQTLQSVNCRSFRLGHATLFFFVSLHAAIINVK